MRSILNTTVFLTAFLFFHINPCQGQLGISFDVKKPKQFQERKLKSEKTGEKKFNLPRRFFQNTTTHYNYFFNANNKLNEVIERAKLAHKDDYSDLLPFYNYSLDMTAADTTQLDSVIYKSMTGIVLHDLRNDWIDNLYLLWGAAYYLRKDFDSANLTFQFINYAFAEKEKDGYYKFIGSRMDGNNALSISTEEKTNLPKKIFSEPPSRNDAFIWQIRTFIARDEFAEAASLISTLKSDPAFPKRLHNDLEEVQALWFYRQENWDSAAVHLSEALDNATNKQERARWEYLAAQLYERTGNFEEAKKLYASSIKHTTDPIMDIYARLNSIRINKKTGEDQIDENIAELLKMAKRDKYRDYRDVIYFMAAQMEMERNNMDAAVAYLQKGVQFGNNNGDLRNRIFLQLAEMAYSQKKYRLSHDYYDSLQLDNKNPEELDAITKRKELLGLLADQIDVIEKQDSLQRIAAMPEEERIEFVKRLLKQLRKDQGLEDASDSRSGGSSASTAQTDLFGGQAKGEWYFYNTSLRTKGQLEFKDRWGTRPNVDNWRRISAVANAARQTKGKTDPQVKKTDDTAPVELTFDALYNNLPLTAEKLDQSFSLEQGALFELGKLYVERIEDCGAATETLERLRAEHPGYGRMDEVLFSLYYCYSKNGEIVKAEAIRNAMKENYAGSRFTTIALTGKDPQAETQNPDATRAYENIYDLFLEGRFDEALQQKAVADSLYGQNHWTPQLLYIEAVYYIKQRQDSLATAALRNIMTQYPGEILASKAENLIEVLSRRQQIEEELSQLEIQRPVMETNSVTTDPNQPPENQSITGVTKTDSAANNQVGTKQPADTISKKPVQPIASVFTNVPEAQHYAVVLLNKVDAVFSRETQNAFFRYNREKYYNQLLPLNTIELNPENKLLLVGPFPNAQAALEYVQKAKPLAPREIVPWLKADKYSFSLITESNLELLKSNPDLPAYKKFIDQFYPGMF